MTSESVPKVSIILPTYKNPPQLLHAIDSVINQSFSNWELIIVDDGLINRDTIEDYIEKDKRINLLPFSINEGIQKSLNKGLDKAKGRYIARIDDDDIWVDAMKLSKQVEFLEKNDGYVLVGTQATIHDSQKKYLGTYSLPTKDIEIRSRMLSKNCFLHPSIMALKDAIEKAGRYDESESVKHIEDYALWLKMGKIGKLANLHDTSVDLLVHSDSVTFQNRIAQSKKLLLLISNYRSVYPNYFKAIVILRVRIIGFYVLKYIPIPKRFLYWIQKIYKNS